MRAQSEPARVRDGLRTQEPDRLRELMNGSCGPEHKDLRVGRGAKRQTSFYKITISVRMARGEGQLHGAISLVTKPVSTYMSFHSEFSLIIDLPRPKYCMSLAMFRPYFPFLPARPVGFRAYLQMKQQRLRLRHRSVAATTRRRALQTSHQANAGPQAVVEPEK